MSNYTLRIIGNREELFRISTRELTVDIAGIFSLLSTVSHTGVDQYGIQNYEEDGDDDYKMTDVMSPSQDPVCRRSLWMRESLIRRRIIWRRPGRNLCR